MKKRYLIPIIILVLIGLVGYVCRDKSDDEIFGKYIGKNIEVVTKDLGEPKYILDCKSRCSNDGGRLYTYEITRTTGTCFSCMSFGMPHYGRIVFTVNADDTVVKFSVYFD